MVKWTAAVGVEISDFVAIFEPEPAQEISELIHYRELTTFREMVQHFSRRFLVTVPRNPSSQEVDMQFIRLLFTCPAQEEVAYRWAMRLAKLLGAEARKLRPETTLSEMLEWAASARVDAMDFVVVFEPELRMEFAEFLDDAEHITFREMAQHYAARFDN